MTRKIKLLVPKVKHDAVAKMEVVVVAVIAVVAKMEVDEVVVVVAKMEVAEVVVVVVKMEVVAVVVAVEVVVKSDVDVRLNGGRASQTLRREVRSSSLDSLLSVRQSKQIKK